MASQLILAAPRPIKAVHLPFFLRNALSPCSPVSPSAALVVGGPNGRRPNSSHGATHVFEAKQPPPMVADHSESTIGYTNNILINSLESNEPTIEQLTARIRLTDDNDASSNLDDSFPSGARSSSSSRQTMSPFGYEKFTQSPSLPPRSPEGAVLEEFLSILRPVIRTPSSPIARSTRLVPRSRRSHQTLGLGPSSDRHHPYARFAKSTSPLESSSESHIEIIGKSTSGSKRSSVGNRASVVSYSTRRRNSNANDSSSHSGRSAGSSRSRSVSRRGSDGSLNYYRSNGRKAVSPSLDSPVPMEINLSIDTTPSSDPSDASLLHLSGVSPLSASPVGME